MPIAKNAIAAQLLRPLGLVVEEEPEWVKSGEVPDFFCTGPSELWVEVKAIGEAERFRVPQVQAQWLSEHAGKVAERGRAFAWVSEDARHRDLKAVIALARDAFREWQNKPNLVDRVFAVVPRDPNFARKMKINLLTAHGTELLVCLQSQSEHYGRPQLGHDLTWNNRAILIESEGKKRTADAFDIGLDDDDFLVALQLEQFDAPFSIRGVMPTGPARQLTTVHTVRAAAKKANSQFKNGCRYRAAPCLLMIFEDGVLVQEPKAFASAFCGDLQYEFNPPTLGDGRLIFGPNGIWAPSANRTTSAACLVRNDGEPMLMCNPWAANPLPTALFGWPQIMIDSNGAVEFPAG